MNIDTDQEIELFKRKISIMEAYKNGAKIQSRNRYYNYTTWDDINTPIWDWYNYEYRVKEQDDEISFLKIRIITDQEKIEVMQAAIDGAKIQSRWAWGDVGEWKTLNSAPSWNWNDFEYRVKPETEGEKIKRQIIKRLEKEFIEIYKETLAKWCAKDFNP